MHHGVNLLHFSFEQDAWIGNLYGPGLGIEPVDFVHGSSEGYRFYPNFFPARILLPASQKALAGTGELQPVPFY